MADRKLSRRELLQQSAGAAALLPPSLREQNPISGPAGAVQHARAPQVSRTIKILFLDNYSLDFVSGFERRMGQVSKYAGNPILRPEKAWEFTRLHVYGTVLRDAGSGLFKMWYPTLDTKTPSRGGPYLCYAVSKDGYDWTRPTLDVVPGTNIVLDRHEHTHGPSVILDPDDPDPSRRYKLLMKPWPPFSPRYPKAPPDAVLNSAEAKNAGDGEFIWAYFSPDGVHWRRAQSEPVIYTVSDSHIGLFRHPATRRYYASMRAKFNRNDAILRRVWCSESEDFLHWTRPVLVLEPCTDDPLQAEIYGMQMTPYGSFVLGWVSMFYGWKSNLKQNTRNDGNLDVQLAHGRSPYCWQRTDTGKRFIPNGEPGSWDAGMIFPSTSPVFLSDEIRFYYSGTPYQHHGPYYGAGVQCVGAASLRPDGFVALHVGENWGEILTRALALREPDIFVNADAYRGELRFEICNETGEALPGFGFADCRPLRSDGIAQRVEWPNGDRSRIVRRPIRLRVRARGTDLYSISMPNGESSTRYWEFREMRLIPPALDLED